MSPKDKFHRIREKIEGTFPHTVREGIESMLPEKYRLRPPYTVVLNPNGRLVVTSNGFHIGYIVDAPFFEHKWFHPAEVEIAAKFEEYVQKVLKDSKPRRYSGLHPYSHIVRDAETAFKIANKADAPLDFEMLLLLIGHDSIEDRQKVGELLGVYEETLTTQPINYNRTKEIGAQLQAEREATRDDIRDKLLGYMVKTGVRGNLRDRLRRSVLTTAESILDVTRFPDQYPYALSMARQYKRVGPESLDTVLIRGIVKDADRSSNLEEFMPYDNMEAVVMAFGDNRYSVDGRSLGQVLREQYGQLKPDAREMPAAVKIGTAFNSLFPLQFQNETLNDKEEGLATSSGRMQELLRLVKHSRAYMTEATEALLESGIDSLEANQDLPRGLRRTADKVVKIKSADSFYFEITPDGFIRDWIMYDLLGREFIENLATKAGKIEEIYRNARDMRVLIPMFGMFYEKGKTDALGRPVLIRDPNVTYDPKIHEHFTLRGVDGLLKEVRGQRFRELVARLKQQYQAEPERHKGTFLRFF